ncbi:hypothetical protein O1611_g8239 [Lasiodiplodia mahajangana]|uniref:Uncharacterized protein n=1 Tax=Lasiodiplodia mahajangana TaxID=1108764 RepID=A0ACC2JD45_9PEZI|nr:hypothetical protein O1611_g8239 [Lasiodiplodia mahajangana]
MSFLHPYHHYAKVEDSSKGLSDPPEDFEGDTMRQDTRSLLHKPMFWRRYPLMILVNAIVFLVYISSLGALAWHQSNRCRSGPNLINSPAYDALEWEEYKFRENSQEHGPYSGYPRPEIDRNWDKLLNAENIILEPEVLKRYGREDLGVAVPEGGGYLGTLNKRLYQYMYQEHYWSDLTDAQRDVNRLHNEHCLDFLRQASMCHADIGLITFQWSPTSRIPIANATTHQCAKWDKIDQWTKERTVDMMKPGWLVHPTKGPAFPKGEGDRLGAMKRPQEQPGLASHVDHSGAE